MTAPWDLDFTDAELHRYSRHILLKEVGALGQARLRAARVLVVGAGGLGSPLALYLAAAGVGTLGLVDHDTLELSNLQRQIAHTTARLGRNKAESAAEALAALNPDCRVEVHARRMDAEAARELIPRYDLVCDGTDNFPTRFLLGDACHLLGRPLVSAAVLRFEGQLSVFRSHEGAPHPCHRCLHPEMPPEGLVPSCSEAGVMGAVVGVMGTLQATEALKLILGLDGSAAGGQDGSARGGHGGAAAGVPGGTAGGGSGGSAGGGSGGSAAGVSSGSAAGAAGTGMSGRLLLWDALDMRFRTVRLRRDPACALCGEAATIRDLSAHRGAVPLVCAAP